jgi:hypothetical protein
VQPVAPIGDSLHTPAPYPEPRCLRGFRHTNEEAAIDLRSLYPLGTITDEGDTVLQVRRLIKGRRLGFRLHDGTERSTGPADRIPNSTPAVAVPEGRINTVRDLAEDKMFTRTYSPVDEFGVPTGVAFDGAMTFATDHPELLNLTDHGDGSCDVAAVGGGALGPAGLTFTAVPNNGDPTIVVVDTINVVVGAPQGFAAVDSPDVEVTPDV